MRSTRALIKEAHALAARDGIPPHLYGEQLDKIRDALSNALISSDGIADEQGSIWGEDEPQARAVQDRPLVSDRPLFAASRSFVRRKA